MKCEAELKPTDNVQVCAHCMKASCWYGVNLCDKALDAGVAVVPVSFLQKLNREDDVYWHDQALDGFYGNHTRDFRRGPQIMAELEREMAQ